MMSPLSMNMNSSMNSLPITRHRLMKAKTFKQQEQHQQQEQQQQQQQQQQQPMMLPLSPFSMAAVPDPTPISIPVFVVTKKSVCFNNCVRVAPFEKVTSTEAKDVWLNSMELAAIKTEGREMASTYRKLLLKTQNQSQESLSKYRGCENVTIQRKRQKILANRSAIYAHLKGYKAEEIAFIYQQSTTFSKEIAFLQAIHDYAEIYTTNTTNAYANALLQQQLPSVASCLPPTPLPFAIESAIFFQRQKREQRNKNQNKKKRTRLASSSRSQSRSRSPPLSPPTSSSPPMSPIAFEQQINVQQQQQQTCQQQQQQQATTVTRRVRQRV